MDQLIEMAYRKRMVIFTFLFSVLIVMISEPKNVLLSPFSFWIYQIKMSDIASRFGQSCMYDSIGVIEKPFLETIFLRKELTFLLETHWILFLE